MGAGQDGWPARPRPPVGDVELSVCEISFLALVNSEGTETINPRVKPSILPNILHVIGNTPLVRINNISKAAGLQCELRRCCYLPNAFLRERFTPLAQWLSASTSMPAVVSRTALATAWLRTPRRAVA